MFKASTTLKSYQKPPKEATINYGHPLTRGLVCCYLFNEGNGTQVTNLVNQHKGNFTNGPIWETSNRSGQGVRFNSASSQYIKVDNHPCLNNIVNGITVEAIVKADRTNAYQFFASRDDGSGNRLYDFGMQSGGAWQIQISTGGSWSEGSGPAADTNLHHVAFGYDGAQLFYTIDGVIRATAARTGVMKTGSNQLNLGAQVGVYNNYWLGVIYYVRIWNRGLSQSEIIKLKREPYCFLDSP